MTHTEDQDVVGIHPEKMQALIGELKAAHRVIAAFAGEFSAPLSALGVSVNTVHQSEHWTSDQVSKLTERLRKFRNDEYSLPPRQASAPGDLSSPGSVGSTDAASGTGASGSTGAGGSTGAAAGGGGTGGGGASGTGGAGRTGSAGGAAHAGRGHPGHAGAAAGSGNDAGAAGYPTGGYPAGGGAPYTPGSPGPMPHAGTHLAAHHATDVQRHATLAAKRVSSDRPSLAGRVWDDIERNASDPQYAAAFLAALGAAGLAVLGAALAKRRKHGQDDREAARRQATLDELTRAARQHEATAESFPVPVSGGPGQPAARAPNRRSRAPAIRRVTRRQGSAWSHRPRWTACQTRRCPRRKGADRPWTIRRPHPSPTPCRGSGHRSRPRTAPGPTPPTRICSRCTPRCTAPRRGWRRRWSQPARRCGTARPGSAARPAGGPRSSRTGTGGWAGPPDGFCRNSRPGSDPRRPTCPSPSPWSLAEPSRPPPADPGHRRIPAGPRRPTRPNPAAGPPVQPGPPRPDPGGRLQPGPDPGGRLHADPQPGGPASSRARSGGPGRESALKPRLSMAHRRP